MPTTTEEIRKPLENNSDYREAEIYWRKKWYSEEEIKELFIKLEKVLILSHEIAPTKCVLSNPVFTILRKEFLGEEKP